MPTRKPTATITAIDQACSPISPPSQIATAMPIRTATIFSTASRIDARTVSRAISDAVIGAQIGDGELSHQAASAQDRPGRQGDLQRLDQHRHGRSPAARRAVDRATGGCPVMRLQPAVPPGAQGAPAGFSATVGGAGSMPLILPH